MRLNSFAGILNHQTVNGAIVPRHLYKRTYKQISRRKLYLGLAAVFLLALILVLAFSRHSQAGLGAASAAVGASTNNSDQSAAAGASDAPKAAPESVSGNNLNVNLQSSSVSNSSGNSSSASLVVNGQNIPVYTGNIHKTITNGTSTVELSQESSSSVGGE